MTFAVALAVALDPAAWVPARWPSNDPTSLALLERSPINYLIAPGAGEAFRVAARVRNIEVVDGIPLHPRHALPFDSSAPFLATDQAVWPGINTKDDEQTAMPSGAPWIDTNAGFLRFARTLTAKPIWLANPPPVGTILPVERYLQAIADAATHGARWVVTLDGDFAKRLLARDFKALKDWDRLQAQLRFHEERREWRFHASAGKLAVIHGVAEGALLSGGTLDMISSKHTPFRVVPAGRLDIAGLNGADTAIDFARQSTATLVEFTRRGGTLLSAAPGWKMPAPKPNQVTLDKADVEKLDAIWKEVNAVTGRKNFGVRLFNVSSMLSNFTVSTGGRQLVLQLANYSNYSAEDITAHLLSGIVKATLFAPDAAPVPLTLFPTDDGTGVEIPRVGVVAAIVFERR